MKVTRQHCMLMRHLTRTVFTNPARENKAVFHQVHMQERREGSLTREGRRQLVFRLTSRMAQSSSILSVFGRPQCDQSSVHKGVPFNLFKWRITETCY